MGTKNQSSSRPIMQAEIYTNTEDLNWRLFGIKLEEKIHFKTELGIVLPTIQLVPDSETTLDVGRYQAVVLSKKGAVTELLLLNYDRLDWSTFVTYTLFLVEQQGAPCGYGLVIANDNCLRRIPFKREALLSLDSDMMVYKMQSNNLIVDFRECNQNWNQYLSTADFRLGKSPSGIGWRDVLGKPPYFDFFTKPITRFLFERELGDIFCRRRVSPWFRYLQKEIINVGWATLDLS
jgi:hypothetical protein